MQNNNIALSCSLPIKSVSLLEIDVTLFDGVSNSNPVGGGFPELKVAYLSTLSKGTNFFVGDDKNSVPSQLYEDRHFFFR